MEFIGNLQKVWPLIGQSPWSFLVLAIAILVVGWTAGRWTSSERIQTLKERVDAYKERLDGASPDEAKRRLDALEAQVQELSPRSLTAAQIDAIAQTVSALPGEIHIAQDMAAADARKLASGFAAAFQKAGWRVQMPSVMGIGNPPPSGIALKVVDPLHLDSREHAIRTAFAKAGISFDLQPGRKARQPETRDHDKFIQNDAEILVTTRSI